MVKEIVLSRTDDFAKILAIYPSYCVVRYEVPTIEGGVNITDSVPILKKEIQTMMRAVFSEVMHGEW